MILGAGHRTTTVDGSTATISVGPGILAHGSGGITGRRGWWRSLAGAGRASAWAISAGFRWLPTRCFARGGDALTTAGPGTSTETSTLRTEVSRIYIEMLA